MCSVRMVRRTSCVLPALTASAFVKKKTVCACSWCTHITDVNVYCAHITDINVYFAHITDINVYCPDITDAKMYCPYITDVNIRPV